MTGRSEGRRFGAAVTPFAPLLLLAAVALGGCGSLPLVGGRGGDVAMAALLEDRVWLEQGSPVPGALAAWLGSGEMLTASCLAVPRLGSWRWTGTAELEWFDHGSRVRAEVAAVGPEELVLLVSEEGFARTLRFRAAEGAAPC